MIGRKHIGKQGHDLPKVNLSQKQAKMTPQFKLLNMFIIGIYDLYLLALQYYKIRFETQKLKIKKN